ncbi:conserved hypothetical protein [Leishmania mexicana MHOM/GT/2001/U1103]|uniref:SET domain-containing protein n=1 Tax=Leishmania mexicana (strain MHOM/GT/2001/U1103) TaxID=929439 RepID=E9AQP3_LEIMU|nr:conserved hypothetical protein [Leishmania mexicana MHOM/GT/2001/U1103]CBZ25262.1 conserved hypothetical protein [Leishmania mexicana MHOM/GT/2001/U1103]
MSGGSTASKLQRLLEAEGAVIHSALQVRALPSMGGGMGVVLKEKLGAGAILARFPFRSMITARKARFNLAMAEVALDQLEGQVATASTNDGREGDNGTAGPCVATDALHVIPFASRVWSECEFEMRVRSRRLRESIAAKVEELAGALDSTETIVCYVLLMAALYGRLSQHACLRRSGADDGAADEEASAPVTEACSCGDKAGLAPTLHYTHENAWMRTWIHALPAQYDNLLELFPVPEDLPPCLVQHGTEPECVTREPSVLSGNATTASPPPPLLGRVTAYAKPSGWLRSYISLRRFQASVAREQQAIQERHAKCCASLRCLQRLPRGVEVAGELEGEGHGAAAPQTGGVVSCRSSPSFSQEDCDRRGHGDACTLGQFLWAFNTLMSRGFYFPEETWAMMPFVDYFNYALESNGTMYPQEDDPEDPECFTNRLLAKNSRNRIGSVAPLMAAAAPRKQQRRTGLRTARVGKAAVPLANYQTYEFQLVQPTCLPTEQVMLHYGAYSDVELLMWYGFTLRPSLLPAPQLGAAPEGRKQGTIPVLPPYLGDADGSLIRAAHGLRLALSQLASATTRVAYYRRCVAPLQRCDGAEASDPDEEAGYKTWLTALHCAYCLPLSPIANAEGKYPEATPGATWLDELLSAFAQTPAVAGPGADAASEDEAAYRIDAWMRRWGSERWSRFAASAFPNITKGCALGVLGLSPVLRAAVHSSFWTPTSERISLSPEERLLVVRGLAWAELYVNMTAAVHADGLTTSSVPASVAAAEFARTMSVDQWTLLRFLALESTDAALEEYVEYVSESEG